jgi:hypothetical protein
MTSFERPQLCRPCTVNSTIVALLGYFVAKFTEQMSVEKRQPPSATAPVARLHRVGHALAAVPRTRRNPTNRVVIHGHQSATITFVKHADGGEEARHVGAMPIAKDQHGSPVLPRCGRRRSGSVLVEVERVEVLLADVSSRQS